MYLYDGKPTASRIATIAATVISSVSVKPASLFMAAQFTGAGPYKRRYSVTIGRRADGRYPGGVGRSRPLHITPANRRPVVSRHAPARLSQGRARSAKVRRLGPVSRLLRPQ